MTKKTWVIIGVIVIILIGGGVYWWLDSQDLGSDQACVSDKYQDIKLDELNEKYHEELAEDLEILCQNPEDKDALLSLASLHDYAKQEYEALVIYDRVLELYPGDTLALNNKANLLYNLKRYDEAEELMLEAIEKNSQWLPAYQLLGEIYQFHKKDVYASNKYPDLLKTGLEKAALPAYQASFYALLGGYYQERGMDDLAIENYEALYEIQPEDYILNQINELKNK